MRAMAKRRAVVLVALALVLGLVPTASGQTSPMRAADGQWTGYVSFVGNGISFRGSFEFESAGGQLDGSFGWAGADVTVGGVVSGPDTRPRFDITSIVSSGIDVPDASGGGEIEFTAATCERLEGDGVFIDVSGRVDISSTVWWAVRRGTSPDVQPFFEALDALRQDVSDILDSLESGAIVVGGVYHRLLPSLIDAEELASQLARSEGCGEEFYRSVITSEVERLFLFALANPDIDVFTFGQLMITAARAGVIGSGNESGGLDDYARDAFDARLFKAIEDADSTELLMLAAIAEDLGWDQLAADAVFAYEEATG